MDLSPLRPGRHGPSALVRAAMAAATTALLAADRELATAVYERFADHAVNAGHRVVFRLTGSSVH